MNEDDILFAQPQVSSSRSGEGYLMDVTTTAITSEPSKSEASKWQGSPLDSVSAESKAADVKGETSDPVQLWGDTQQSKNENGDWDDGDDFGDFVESAPCVSEASARPSAAVGAHSEKVDEWGEAVEAATASNVAVQGIEKEEPKNEATSKNVGITGSAVAWGRCDTASEGISHKDPLSITFNGTSSGNTFGAQTFTNNNTYGSANNNSPGVDDDEWMDFQENGPTTVQPSKPLSATSTSASFPMDCGLAGSLSLLSGGGNFEFEQDFDTALLAKQLFSFTGCTVDTSAGANRKMDYHTNTWALEGPSNQRESYSAGDIVTAMMEAFFFRRRKIDKNVAGTFQGVGTLFVSHISEMAARKLRNSTQSLQNMNLGATMGGKMEERWDVIGDVDPVTAVRIAELHTIRFFSNTDSFLLQPMEAQTWQVAKGPIPICDVIAKVKALNAERQKQQQYQSVTDVTADLWTVHPLLPTPHIGGSVSPAPSLQLPF